LKSNDEVAAWLLDSPWSREVFEPEAYDSGQRKRYLRCEHDRVCSLLKQRRESASISHTITTYETEAINLKASGQSTERNYF
jgi:hypothetical protein